MKLKLKLMLLLTIALSSCAGMGVSYTDERDGVSRTITIENLGK